MNKKRVYEILKSKEKYDVFYDNRPVWIQEVENKEVDVDEVRSTEPTDTIRNNAE